MSVAVGARPSNTVTDALLSIELFALLFLWLREWPNVKGRHELYVSYALNLLGAASWCASGAYIHTWEPLPQEPTLAWQVFLNLGAATPFLFPLVIRDSFFRANMSATTARMQDLIMASMAIVYGVLAACSVDLAMGRPLPPVWVTPWHILDGSSYGGKAFGIDFDLLSVMPSARSDSQFVLSGIFMSSNCFSAFLCLYFCYKTQAKEAERRAARRLTGGVIAMLLNCQLLAVLVGTRTASSTVALDIFHVLQGLIIPAAWCQLRMILRERTAANLKGE